MLRIVIVLISCSVLCGCFHNTADVSQKEIKIANLVLQVPSDVGYMQVGKAYGFQLYEFTYDGNTLFNMYLGNQPNIDKEMYMKNGSVEEVSYNNIRSKRFSRTDSDGIQHTEVLLYLENEWPYYGHIYYQGLSEEYNHVVEQILQSAHKLEPVKKLEEIPFEGEPPPLPVPGRPLK